MTNELQHRLDAAAILAEHMAAVDDVLEKALAAATPGNLVANPGLATGIAALAREKREALQATIVAHENAAHAARRGGRN